LDIANFTENDYPLAGMRSRDNSDSSCHSSVGKLWDDEVSFYPLLWPYYGPTMLKSLWDCHHWLLWMHGQTFSSLTTGDICPTLMPQKRATAGNRGSRRRVWRGEILQTLLEKMLTSALPL